ncbi:MAG: hypothetical protein AABZ74_13995 [Cyanobacteriota bacterium]
MNRQISKIIKELSEELDFNVNFLSSNWIIELQKKEKISYIFGYDWELNSSSSQLISKDKVACYEVLNSKNIPSIEHKLFLNPQIQEYISSEGNWKEIIEYCEKYNYKIVCKSNTGSGGNEVFKIDNQKQIEIIINNLFNKNINVSLSPFYEIKNEYRVIVFYDEVLLVYKKEKDYVLGDGKKTVLELIQEKIKKISLIELDFIKNKLTYIVPENEKFEITWKHNLAKGAKASIVDNKELLEKLNILALKASQSIKINFASVDIVETENDFLIMEINSGIMMENFSKQGEKEYQISKNIYRKAINKLFIN